MNTNDLINRSIYIITEYYENNLEPFFENLSDDVFWLGPAEGQSIRGKQNILNAWAAEEHSLNFTMGSIKAQYISPASSVKEILLQYDIYTHYPSGHVDMHKQRLHYTWRERRKKTSDGWDTRDEIVMIHISNLWQYDSRDAIYPVHYENMYAPNRSSSAPERYVTLRGLDRSVYRVLADHVLSIETVKRSARLIVHTKEGPITVNGTLPEFERKYPGLFVRIHASYLINPSAVREIRRFIVTLSDGTELPIPEKKYTAIKKQLLQDEG